MRYTEAFSSAKMLRDIDKETVSFSSTSMTLHNQPCCHPYSQLADQRLLRDCDEDGYQHCPPQLTECINGIIAYIDDREMIPKLMEHIKA